MADEMMREDAPQEKSAMGIDAVLSNIQHYAFDICLTLMSIDYDVSRILKLEEPLTASQARALKKEMGMTDTAIKVLRRCKANWQSIQRDLDTLSPWMYGKVKKGAFDYSCAMTNELIAIFALYLVQTDCDEVTTRKVLDTLVSAKPLSEDVKLLVGGQLKKANKMRRRIFEKMNQDAVQCEEGGHTEVTGDM